MESGGLQVADGCRLAILASYGLAAIGADLALPRPNRQPIRIGEGMGIDVKISRMHRAMQGG